MQKSWGLPDIFYRLSILKDKIEMLNALTEINYGHHWYKLVH